MNRREARNLVIFTIVLTTISVVSYAAGAIYAVIGVSI